MAFSATERLARRLPSPRRIQLSPTQSTHPRFVWAHGVGIFSIFFVYSISARLGPGLVRPRLGPDPALRKVQASASKRKQAHPRPGLVLPASELSERSEALSPHLCVVPRSLVWERHWEVRKTALHGFTAVFATRGCKIKVYIYIYMLPPPVAPRFYLKKSVFFVGFTKKRVF